MFVGVFIWCVGVDFSMCIKIDVVFEIGGKVVLVGEYSFLIEFKEGVWMVVFLK